MSTEMAYELSLAVALATGVMAHYCYANAWHASEALAEWSDLLLVEGWVVLEQTTQVTLIEHCWLEHGNPGRIIDPSMVLLVPRSLLHQVHYFAGVRRTRAEMQTVACGDLPLVRSSGSYGPDGLEQVDYCTAYAAAHSQATQLACASSPAKTVVIQPAAFPETTEARSDLVVRVTSSQTLLRTPP
jgi:hypothetical protein